jgi:hypothetical protein
LVRQLPLLPAVHMRVFVLPHCRHAHSHLSRDFVIASPTSWIPQRAVGHPRSRRNVPAINALLWGKTLCGVNRLEKRCPPNVQPRLRVEMFTCGHVAGFIHPVYLGCLLS